MARTPLAKSLKSLWRDLTISRRTGVPLDELPELRRAARRERAERGGLSRRHFLAGAGLGAAALALPRAARAATGDPTVVIVGGGIAGLNCALWLADHNIESTVYEASGRIGGRMYSNRTGYWANNQVSEWGGELIDTGHTTVQALAARFGLPLDDLHAAEPAGSSEVYRFFNQYYAKTQADADFDAIFHSIKTDLHAAPFPTTFDSFTAAGAALDHTSVYDYIESRVPGGHDAPLGALLDTAYAIEYGADSMDQSSLNLLYLLAFQPKPFDHTLAVFGESDETYHIRGGNQQLPEAIASALGPRVVMNNKLVKLKQTAGGRYRCTFEHNNTTSDVTADYVVLAIPFAVLANVDTSQAGFDALKNQAIAQLGRGHNGKLHLQFTSRGWLGNGPWPGKANGSSYADTGYQATWEVTRAQPGAAGILVEYSGGSVTDSMHTTVPFATATDANVRRDATEGLAELASVFPNLHYNGKATQSIWHKAPLFNNSYSYWKTGQYTAFAGYEGVTLGGVLFCGEHTSTDFQGFMEGGAEQGERAARELKKKIRGA